MPDLIDDIKSASNCRALYRRFWPGFYREHGNSQAFCHDDSTASMQLNKDFAYCHACGSKLDAIDLYQTGAGVEKSEAIRLLSEELNLAAPSKPAKRRSPRHKPPKAWIDRWRSLIKNSVPQEAIDYLETKRGLQGMAAELIQEKKISFDPKYSCRNHDTKQYEHWRVIGFPLLDADQKTMLGIQYVSIDGHGKKFATGTNGKGSFFFHGSGKEFCVVTGAVIDALSAYLACRKTMDLEVCSILSEERGYTPKLANLRRNAPVLFFDNDQAGRDATDQAVKILKTNCRLVDWSLAPPGMKDVNDLLRAGHADVIERMVRASKVPTEEEVKALDGDEDILKQLLEELNKHHAVVMMGGRCVVINESQDPAFGGIAVTYSSPDDFRHFYRNRKVWVPSGEGKTKQVDIGKVWLESEERRQYKGIVFNPGVVESNCYYNLFRGFSCQPRKGDWRLFRDHIYHVIADNDRDRFAYLIAWMAHTVQHCGDHRPGVTIVLRGGQGAGKGCFATVFGRLFGPHFQHIWQTRQLTGNFNQHLKDAIVVFVDEGFWAGDKQSEGVLKAMISEERIAVEPKGKDVFYVRNFMRIIIASNNQWVVPAGLNERRFFVLSVSAAHQQDKAYFDAIYRQMESGGYAAMLHDLMEVDISGFDLAGFPRTEALFDQIYHTMPSIQKFWYEKLRSYSMHEEIGATGRWPEYFITASIYEEYLGFCKSMGERHPISDRIFSMELKRMCPGIMRTRKNPDNTSRVWCLDVPDLLESRSKFQAFVGRAPVDWEDDARPDFMARDGTIYN